MPSLLSQSQNPMLTITPPEAHQSLTCSPQSLFTSFHNIDASSTFPSSTDDITNMPHRLPDPDSLVAGVPSTSPTFALKMGSSQPAMSDVSQALEIARESPAGASDPTVGKILDQAIAHIWSKIQAKPDDYVMTREEFSVFNYFQHRFTGNKAAAAARARFWDKTNA